MAPNVLRWNIIQTYLKFNDFVNIFVFTIRNMFPMVSLILITDQLLKSARVAIFEIVFLFISSAESKKSNLNRKRQKCLGKLCRLCFLCHFKAGFVLNHMYFSLLLFVCNRGLIEELCEIIMPSNDSSLKTTWCVLHFFFGSKENYATYVTFENGLFLCLD